MIENNFFTIGEGFYTINSYETKLMTVDAKLEFDGIVESMHEIAGKMLHKTMRFNAFDHLYVKRNNQFVSIDEIRNNYCQFKLANSLN
ncbi:hypothetical protein [Mycoplasmopsis columbina]|uniref:Modification methylase n=1 Tax=Mycoplasmopsis columbina SF7 TaxID=1037410 RepID=F9UKE5_9BACT|nr:hypothetical protein [Mycoplasmopsis columbina]EGV00150.1 modification methylase [Mycoplasmopsis columbina SF7]VEU77043.1 Uncharacterised protein [Mycoplasmopsis columbina]